MKQKVVVGLSGGVDSSVAAALLIEQGYDVHGVYLECYNEPGCRTDQDKKDALQVALKLGIEFTVLDFRKEYKEKVVEYFYREYEAGRTPNPDVMCNREIKFGIFYDWALSNDYDFVATGHYCRIADRETPESKVNLKINEGIDLSGVSRKVLQRARDESKDQSYFLWRIPGDHLEHILFPLGNMLKTEVRAKAKELGLSTANKPDSMGICFIGEVNVNQLLEDRLGEHPGEVVMRVPIGSDPVSLRSTKQPAKGGLSLAGQTLTRNEVVGSHRGLWFYTIGERGGFDIDKKILKKIGLHPEKMGPLYVIGKDQVNNLLIVGGREETMRDSFRIIDDTGEAGLPAQVGLAPTGTSKLFARIRNLGELYEVSQLRGGIVTLKEPIFAVAEGQSTVFYDDQAILVGGGIIV